MITAVNYLALTVVWNTISLLEGSNQGSLHVKLQTTCHGLCLAFSVYETSPSGGSAVY
jgi:hypothetical protein